MTTFQLNLQKAKRLGTNLTILATSISLAACGGGGSEGYFGNNNSGGTDGTTNPDNGSEVKEVAGVTLVLSKSELNVKGDNLTVTAKAVDKDGGGIANQKISLNIKDALKNGATADVSEVSTDEKGNATFTINLSGTNIAVTELVLTATVVGTTINNIKKVAVTGAGTVTQSQYELKFDNISPLMVSGGESTVRVRALDANGGGVPNENVVLKVKDFEKNGVSIKGLSSAVTDNQGYAEFTLSLPAGKEGDRLALMQEGISLEAVLTEASGASKTQVYKVGVSSVANVVTKLDISTSNNNKIEAIGGLINVVVKATNPEGASIANKNVQLVLDAQAVQYGAKLANAVVKTNNKGEAVFTIQTEANADNPDGKLLVQNGISVKAILQDNASIFTQDSKITVSSPVAEDVASLNLAVAGAIKTSGGEANVTVIAKDKNGGAIANRTIKLTIPQVAGLSIKNGSTATTDSNGRAEFTLSFNAAGVDQAVINSLISKGVTITAQYTAVNNKTVTQTGLVNFYQTVQEVQRIELTATKGIVNSTNDTFQVKARALDNDGDPAVNKPISLGLSANVMENGVSFEGKVTKNTDKDGYVSFTVHTNALNEQAIEKLVSSGIVVAVSTKLADGSIVTQNTTVMVAPSALSAVEVAYLDIIDPATLDISKPNKDTSIVVQAYKSNGDVSANKDIIVSLDKKYAGISIDNRAPTTNSTGQASFGLRYDPEQLSSADQLEILQKGLSITARFGNITQKTKISFYSLAANIQRMDLVVDKPALVATVGTAQKAIATVTLKDSAGAAIKDRQVIIALDPAALQQGARFTGVTGGSTAVTTDATGQATVELTVNAANQAMLNALIISGIGIGASAVQGDGSGTISQSTKINVLSEAAENEVGYLTTDSGSVIATTGGDSTITVKAFNGKGVAVEGKTVKLNLGTIPAGLNIKVDNASQVTDAAGNAVFKVTYTAASNLTADQIKALLAGISATASYTNSAGKLISQNTIIQFSADAAIAQDAQRLELTTSKGTVNADDDTFTFTAKVIGNDGNPLAGKFLGIGLEEAAMQNGVSFAGAQQVQTDANGLATFTINVNGVNQQTIDNLVANGINLSASIVQANGTSLSQTTRVMVKAPEASTVAKLEVNPSTASISSVGGSSVIAVRALDNNDKPVANQNISFALAGTNARVKVDQSSALTNNQGYAYFTVSIANGDLEDELIKNGITYAVNTINQATGKTYSQVGKISVSVPAGTYNLLPLTPSKPSLLITGDTVTITSKLVDNKGAPLKSQPVTLVVNNVAVNGGVNVEGGFNAVTDASGNVSFKVTLPAKTNQAQIDELLNNGLTIKTSVTLPNGNKRYSPDLNLNVEAAINPNHLEIMSSNENLSVNGDKAIITVRLLTNAANQPVADQQVTLKVKKTSSTTGTNIGIVNEAEGNEGITDTYTVTTDQNGNGFFTLLIPESGLDKDALFASGIELEASQTDSNGITVKQVNRLGLDKPGSTAPRYTLRIASSKPTLNVRNDTTDVVLTLLDQNGGAVEGKYVTLNIADFVRNGASIVSASGKNTDANGQAVFTVKVDETARNQNYTAAAFDSDNLVLRATFYAASTQDPATLQDFMINVVQANVPNPIGNLTFGKSALLEKSDDGNYYTESVSAQLVDKDGRPLANQSVMMSIDLLGISKGFYFPTKDADGNPTRSKSTSINCFGVNLPASAAVATAFVSSQGSTNDIVTYTTDSTGKFDFRIRYLRQYAGWQTVNLTAKVVINGQPVQNLESGLNYPLSMLKDDFDSEAGQPFDTSPYGTNATCQ